jgi:oligoribonuclease NrnB/cAMP/cGMP phosphodiesterase (DHH superfamily)
MESPVGTVVLYHRGCNDGIASALVARQFLPEDTEFLPYQYGEDIPSEVVGKHLILVDLSLTPEQLHDVYPLDVESVLIIDHHASAIKKLTSVNRVANYHQYLVDREMGGIWAELDSNHSGAVLTWGFFNNMLTSPNWVEHIPTWLRYINDYDLWRHELPETKAINAWINVKGRTLEGLSDGISGDDFKHEVYVTGNVLLEYDQQLMRSVARGYAQIGTLGEMDYVLVNGPHHLRNEMADYLLELFDVVVCYNQREDKTVFSLRSSDHSNHDVSVIAEKFGGGGHRNSAAFSVPNNVYRNTFVQNPFTKPTFGERLKMIWWALTTRSWL